MNHLLTFIFCFTIIYLLYFIVVINRKKGIEKFKEGKQLEFFKNVYKLDIKKLNIKAFANHLALTNAFIMSFTITIVELIDHFALKMLVGFIILIALMLIMYKILGKAYKKKEGK